MDRNFHLIDGGIQASSEDPMWDSFVNAVSIEHALRNGDIQIDYAFTRRVLEEPAYGKILEGILAEIVRRPGKSAEGDEFETDFNLVRASLVDPNVLLTDPRQKELQRRFLFMVDTFKPIIEPVEGEVVDDKE